MASSTLTGTKRPFQLTPPPKEFFRQFANLAHNRVLNEDFPHEKHLTLKYKGSGTDFIVNAKGSLSVKTQPGKEIETVEGRRLEVTEKVDTYPTSSEVKILTGYHETSTEARFNSKGITKVWTNWGTHNVGEPIEVVSVVKGDNEFKKTKGWVAAYYTRGPIGSGTRLQVRHHKNYTFSLGQKLTYAQNHLWGGAYIDLNLNDLKLTQYNAILGYNVNKNIHFYAEHSTSKEVDKSASAAQKTTEITTTVVEKTTTVEGVNGPLEEKRRVEVDTQETENVPLLKRIGFGKGTLNGVYKDDKIWALAQIGWEETIEKLTFDAGAVYTINRDSSVRAKVNQDLNLAIGARHKLNRNISLNIGTNVPLSTPEKFYNSYNTVPIPFGASLEFNF